MAITNNPTIKPAPMPSTPRTSGSQTQKKSAPAKTAIAPVSADDDVIQQGLQAAQSSLDADQGNDVDQDRVAAMQALIASGEFTLDTDALASSMLSFFQK